MESRRPSLIGPLFLITIGVLFLLANMGMLPAFNFWQIAIQYWPLLLILIGLDILIGRRSALGALVILILWVALIGGMVWLASGQGGTFLPAPASVTEDISQPLGDIRSATLYVHVGLSDLSVNSLGTDSGDLVKGSFRHSGGTRVVKNYEVLGDAGRLSLSEQASNWFLPGTGASRWDLGLNPSVPMALTIGGGVGRSVLDLSALRVTALSIDAGVGSIDVTTPQTGTVTLRLNGGVGTARVSVPAGVAARIRASAGLGRVDVNPSRFPRFGDVYQSVDYPTATNKLDVDIDGGVGSISIP